MVLLSSGETIQSDDEGRFVTNISEAVKHSYLSI